MTLTVLVVALEADASIKGELRNLCGLDVKLVFRRVACSSSIENAKTFGSLAENFASVVHQSVSTNNELGARVQAVVFGCTSATAVLGIEVLKFQIRHVFSHVSKTLPVLVTPLTAAVACLRFHNVKRLAVLSPYVDSVAGIVVSALTRNGFEVVAQKHLNEPRDKVVCQFDPAVVAKMVQDFELTPGQVDGVFVSCTSMKLASELDNLTRVLKLPVVSSNSAVAWRLNTLLKKKSEQTVREKLTN